MLATSRTEAAIARCAEILTADLDRASERLVEELVEAVPELAADDDLRRETAASAHGNVAAMLSVFRGEDTAQNVPIDPAVLVVARSLARRRVPIDRLIQSYRVGQALFWRLWMSVLTAEIEDRDELVAALSSSSDQLSAYLDRVDAAIVTEHAEERDRWLRRSVARRAEAVDRILRGLATDVDGLSSVLGHELRLCQTGLVLWGQEFEDPDRLAVQLDSAVAELGRRLGTRPFKIEAGMSSVFAWLGTNEPLDSETVRQAAEEVSGADVFVAIGRSLAGLEGFRRSHEQALRAQRVAVRMTPAPGAITYDGVEVIALLSDDENELREFVARELGALAARDASTARLRETVRVLLEEGGNARLASERLFTHKNTVLYRAQRAEQLLGRSVRSGSLSLQLALHVADLFGERVLGD